LQLLKIAKSYLKQAEASLKDARDALSEDNYPYAVRLSQECVELSLKAALKAVGIDYPKKYMMFQMYWQISARDFPNGSGRRWTSYANQARSSRKRGR